MPYRKMSNEDQRVQHETIKGIDTNVTDAVVIVKKIWSLWPVLCAICTVVGIIIGSTITVYLWNQSLVKQAQFSRHEQREYQRDSMMLAKIDTNRAEQIKADQALHKRIDELPVLRFTNVTQTRTARGLVETRIN